MNGFLDIHSHILPCVDDGARNIDESLELLKIMKSQGITDVVATPHFYAAYDNLEDHLEKVKSAYLNLVSAAEGLNLPNIYLGNEVFYFHGIGKSESLKSLCINNSPFLLLELPIYEISDSILQDINELHNSLGIVPIIAHIERYSHSRGFKNLLKTIKNGAALAQLNASSVLDSDFKRISKRLIKEGYISFIATDTHSVDVRPPLLSDALDEISKKFGEDRKTMYIQNSQKLLERFLNKNGQVL